ncbi:MAG: T9SS type A sorting domain-containing protein, partial [Bacteroidota bacterium]
GSVIDSVISGAFEDVNQALPAPWAQRGYQYENARRRLAELIANTTSPLPYGSFGAVPPVLDDGPDSVRLQWSSLNATSASIDQGIGSVPVNGSRTVFVDQSKTFTLSLRNDAGSRTYPVTVTMRRLPTGTLHAAPDTLPEGGGATTLSWTSANATGAVLDNGIGAVPVNGSVQVQVDRMTTFTLTLSNADGTHDLQTTVLVRGLPTGQIVCDPDTIPATGTRVEISWSSFNAQTAVLDHGIGAVGPEGTVEVFVSRPTQFTLTLANAFGVRTYTASIHQSTGIYTPNTFVSVPPESLVSTDPDGVRPLRPVRRGRGLYPNWANLLSEMVVQGGFQPGSSESDPAGGLVVGISSMEEVAPGRWRPVRDSAEVRSWVRLTRWKQSRSSGSGYTDVQASLRDRKGYHAGDPRGFDSTGAPGERNRRRLIKQQIRLGPRKHDNRLFAELVACKVSIAASQLGKTPPGFGELELDLPESRYHGMMLKEIAARGDSLLTHWTGRNPQEYSDLYYLLASVNRAFAGRLDTLFFEAGGQLMINGAVHLSEVPFLRYGGESPARLTATTTLTSSPEDELEEEYASGETTALSARLLPNYPNPFNPSTTLSFLIAEDSRVTLEVYNILGQRVAGILEGEDLAAGMHEVEFVPQNLPSGIYFYRVSLASSEVPAAVRHYVGKMLLVK